MRVSEFFDLDRTQPTLEFVDVDVVNDVRLFLDPRSVRLIPSDWGEECHYLLQDFFTTVLRAITEQNHTRARELLEVLREPNETHLGLSEERSQGHALGEESASHVWKALSESEAARTGLLEDLEDTVLLVPGVGPDIVSDMTTGILRRPLVEFTGDCCRYYGIPMEEVGSGAMWNALTHEFDTDFVELPVVEKRRLLLVPKALVRIRTDYDPGEYYNHYLLEELRSVELSANSALVEVLKNGGRRVTKKSLRQKYGSGKEVIVRETLNHPEVLERYRTQKRAYPSPPLSHQRLADASATTEPDWDALLADVQKVEPGNAGATAYHWAVEALLGALFYPALVNPRREFKIHQGRKRIDIVFTNSATAGFFQWLVNTHGTPAAYVLAECKNYSRPLENPELDQIAGRFAPQRGKLGFLVYRGFTDKDGFWESCRDTARDERGYIIPLDDMDLAELIDDRKRRPESVDFGHVRRLFERLL